MLTLFELKMHAVTTCKSLLQERIAFLEQAMQEAQDAANAEEKSSAGDKYETSRSMGQLNKQMHAKQLQTVITELNGLNKLETNKTFKQVEIGTLIKTNLGYYFIGIGLGKIKVGEVEIATISAQAPLAKMLLGKKIGEQVVLMNRTEMIEGLI